MGRRPLVPRLHLFEIDDQEWFPSYFRWRVQAALTIAWTFYFPIGDALSPAQHVARVLNKQLGSSVRDYVFIDFCAGGGGPTPSIEQELNRRLRESGPTSGSTTGSEPTMASAGSRHKDIKHPTYAEVALAAPGSAGQDVPEVNGYNDDHDGDTGTEPVQFVLTDLHPHAEYWAEAARQSPNIHYEPQPVDAANAPPELIRKYKSADKKILRLFNLAFHHFDDSLARAILKNTVETSDGFAIFELQDRSFNAFLTCCLFGVGVLLLAPVYAWRWRSPLTLFFAWVVPILPFVLVFDGWVSSLRTRTPDEVELLLRTCGAESKELDRWEVRSGELRHLWPCGYLHWIVCVKK